MRNSALERVSFVFVLITIISIIVFGLNFYNQESILILLPMIYLVFFIGFMRIYKFINYPGMFMLNAISFIRLLIIPLSILFSTTYTDTHGYFFQGSTLMVFETILLTATLLIVTNKYYKDDIKEKTLKVENEKYWILNFVVLIAMTIIIFQPQILAQYSFAFTDLKEIELIKGRSLVTGIDAIIVDLGKLFLPLVMSIPLINKFKQRKNIIYYLLTILIILFLNVLVFSGTSRSSMLIPAAASIFYLMNAFPKQRKQLFVFMSVMILVVVIQLTILKLAYTGVEINSSTGGIIDYLEAYFVGPRNIGVSIKAKEIYGSYYSLETFFNDLFGNFPGLSKNFNLENRTNTFFNLTYYYGGPQRDQIIPSIGQGFFYFGTLFSFLPQLIIILFMVKFDQMYAKVDNLVGVYFFSYFAVKFGFTFAQSLSSSLGFLYSTVIPVVFIYYSNQLINKLVRKRR